MSKKNDHDSKMERLARGNLKSEVQSWKLRKCLELAKENNVKACDIICERYSPKKNKSGDTNSFDIGPDENKYVFSIDVHYASSANKKQD